MLASHPHGKGYARTGGLLLPEQAYDLEERLEAAIPKLKAHILRTPTSVTISLVSDDPGLRAQVDGIVAAAKAAG